jgi:hypothetical protein
MGTSRGNPGHHISDLFSGIMIFLALLKIGNMVPVPDFTDFILFSVS